MAERLNMTDTPSKFNTIYAPLHCPHCKAEITSGVGFRAGSLLQARYNLGDKLNWEGDDCCPAARPPKGNLRTIGYFNCDNMDCTTWQDCYPEVQQALVVVNNDVIKEVKNVGKDENFAQYAIVDAS
jgi:hypothetical protein